MNFYVLYNDQFNNYKQIDYQNYHTNIQECKKCCGVRVIKTSCLEVSFKGTREQDFYKATPYIIINKRLQDILILNKLTGFHFEEIKIQENSKKLIYSEEVSHYKELVITGRSGYLRKLNNEVVIQCDDCKRPLYKNDTKINGFSINENEWNKSDFFYMENVFGLLIVTEKVKKLFTKEKIKNVKFVPIKEYIFI